MIKNIYIQDFFTSINDVVLIDVRSPGEYKKGHIAEAHNIPLFSDIERAKVGTLYKQKGREEAIIQGLEFVGPKMKQLVETAKNIAQQKKIVLYCWRGGMRSGSVAWLYQTAGLNVSVIKGGYKSYRKLVSEQFEKDYKLIMLGGPTGSKKTEILHYLKNLGEQVIDLEALAHHKGSAFGNLDGLEQPDTETFENNLALELMKMNKEKVIWIEDESKTIGTSHIPNLFWAKMKQAPLIYLELPLYKRINYLVEDYGKYPKEALQSAIDKIKKRLGGLAYKDATDALMNDDFKKTASIMLNYYDSAYYFNSYKREDKTGIYHFKTETDEIGAMSKDLLKFIKNIQIPVV
jgi:tRNA 2-selenouridine synthase